MRKLITKISLFLAVTLQMALAAPSAQVFATPENAVTTLAQAIEQLDRETMMAVMGSGFKKLEEINPEARRATMKKLHQLFLEGWTLTTTENDEKIVRIGHEGWAFPVPLVKVDSGWSFDSEAGFEEIQNRMVGRNELLAIETSRFLGQAQELYKAASPTKSYAAKIVSDEGKMNGLYWPADAQGEVSPLGQMFDSPTNFQTALETPQGWFGYSFVILSADQSGFKIVAYPVEHLSTGVMTFFTDASGKVYEKNLELDASASLKPSQLGPDEEGWSMTGEQL